MTNLNLLERAMKHKMNRRTFLHWSAVVTAGMTMTGCESELKKIPEDQANKLIGKEGQWITAACWHNCGGRCYNKAYIVDGVVVRQGTDDTHPDTPDFPQQRACQRGRSQNQQVFSADRIKYPMKRKNWAPGGGQKELRGVDQWVRISWDEALDIVASEITRIKNQHGNEAILTIGGAIGRSINKIGGSAQAWGNTSWGTWYYAGVDMGLGDGWVIRPINDRLDIRNSDLVVIWGANPAWSSGNSAAYNYLQAKKAGAEFIFIDPMYSDSARVLADQWIPIRPSTDHAFAIAVAYTLLDEDDPQTNPLIDWDFLRKYTVGFERETMPAGADPTDSYQDYLLGTKDNIPKTPEWAAEICGVEPEQIRAFARKLAKAPRAAIITGWAPARTHNTDSWPQAFMTLGCMTGNIGAPGKMTGISCHFVGGNGGPHLVQPGSNGVPGIPNPCDVSINNAELWNAILTGKYTASSPVNSRFLGTQVDTETEPTIKDCNIQMIYHGAAARLNQLCGAVKGIEAHRKVEFVLTQHYSYNTQARYSDVVLPITTMWERFGHVRDSQEILILAQQIIEPMFEAKDDIWIDVEIGKRLGLDATEIDPFPENQKIFNSLANATVRKEDNSDWETLFTITPQDIKEWGVQGEPQTGRIPLKDFMKTGIYQVPRKPNDALTYIHLKEFIDDPENNKLDTDSGKLEIYCQRIADRVKYLGFSQIEPVPKYTRPIEGYEDTFEDWDNKVKGQFPLQLVTVHHRRRAHSIFDNAQWLREAFAQDLMINPQDANAFGIKDGETVKISSRHGAVVRPVKLTEVIKPGVVALGQGAWIEMDEQEGVDKAGNTNILNGGIPTGQGHMGWNSCNVRIEKYHKALEPDHKWPARVIF